MARFLLLLVPACLLVSCSLFKEPVFERLNEVTLRDITVDNTGLDLSLVIHNPNWYSITVNSLKVDVSDTAAQKMGDIVMTQPLKIARHASDTVYFEIQMETRKVTRLLSHSAQNAEFIIKADARAKVFGIGKRVRMEKRQSVNFTQILEQLLPSIPEEITIPTIVADKKRKVVVSSRPNKSSPVQADIFKVLKTSVTDVGLKESDLTVKFQLLNPYGLSFTIRDFPSDIWINDKYAGKGKLARPLAFTENIYQAEGEMVFTLNNINTLGLAAGALFKKDMDYRVKGTLQAEGFGLKIAKPFRFNGTVEIGKKDKD